MPANPRPPDDTGELDDLLHFVARDAIADLSTDDFLRAFQAKAETIAPVMFGAIDDPSARLGLADSMLEDATWHDVLAAATRALAAA